MNVPALLPSRDLLTEVYGVERGLRRGRRARLLGVLLAAVQITILLANSSWVEDLLNADWDAVLDRWPLLVSLFLLVLAVLMASWTRFWLRESKQPFQYTYSVAPFKPLEGEAEQPRLVAMDADIRERLSLRIRRLSLLESGADDPEPARDAEPEGAREARTSSHIHVAGQYALRKRPPDPRWFVEITPWVRIGGPGRPATLGVPVKYALDSEDDEPPMLDRKEYERILERTYFSIATEVYRQIKEDVSRKVDLLPNRWFRATALLHEAEDYARSNTLDAYEQARELYAATLGIYDPDRPLCPNRHFAGRGHAAPAREAAVGGRSPRPQLGDSTHRPLRGARRARPGGLRQHPAGRLRSGTPLRVEGTRCLRGGTDRGSGETPADQGGRRCAGPNRQPVRRASSPRIRHPGADGASTGTRGTGRRRGRRSPARGNRPSLSVRTGFARGAAALGADLYQRAVEQAPRFEAAQFQLAQASEMLWRTRPTLEPNVAETVISQYGEVLRLNPGNIAAWANCGYMLWLLGKQREAKTYLDGGRRFKEIKREAYVAEVDHGLARIAAELGEFERAYDHYIKTVSARIAHGWATGSYDEYHFDFAGDEILKRFKSYCDTVEAHCKAPTDEEKKRTTERVRKSVHAFALYDYSQACYRYYLRTHDYTVFEDGDRRAEGTRAQRALRPRCVPASLAGDRACDLRARYGAGRDIPGHRRAA